MTGTRGLVWPLLLIAVGILFLAANFGAIAPVRVLDVLNLWPLILVLVGIDLALAHRWPLAALGADLLVILLGVALVVAQPSVPTWLSAGTATGESSVSVPRGDATSLALRVNGGAGTYRIAGGAGALLEATSDQSDLRIQSSRRSNGSVDVRLDQSEDRAPFHVGSSATHIEVRISSGVPASLDLNMGAGDFVLDLADVAVTDARVNVGAASLRLVAPRPTGDVAITVSAGASSVVIEIPDGVEARVTTSGALTSLRSENPRLVGSETTGYAASKDHVTIRVTAGASSVTIR